MHSSGCIVRRARWEVKRRCRRRHSRGILDAVRELPARIIRATCLLLALTGLTAAWGADAPQPVDSPPGPAAESAPPEDERLTVYRAFRRAFFAGQYEAALPLATQVLELTRTQFGADAPQLANPLTNLGTTYYRMGNFAAALDNYGAALRLLDLQGEAANEQLVRPLHGMGAALRGQKRDADAIAPFKRAVEILRNRQGLHSVTQLPLLEELIACYISTGRLSEAGREQQYAFGVAEAAYGKDDVRMIGPLEDYALWHEAGGRYTAARVLHVRAIEVADKALGATNLQAIPALRGVARTYRLAYVFGEAEEQAQTALTLQEQVSPNLIARASSAPSSEGERALRNALDRLGSAPLPQQQVRGAVLIDLGDWYLTAGLPPRAMSTYREAWTALGPEAGMRALGNAEPVVYRPPPVAVSRHQYDSSDHDEQDVLLRLHIEADGDVREAIVTNPAPQRESAEKAVITAVKRAQWRPAFRDGEPVASPELAFREPVFVRRPKEK